MSQLIGINSMSLSLLRLQVTHFQKSVNKPEMVKDKSSGEADDETNNMAKNSKHNGMQKARHADGPSKASVAKPRLSITAPIAMNNTSTPVATRANIFDKVDTITQEVSAHPVNRTDVIKPPGNTAGKPSKVDRPVPVAKSLRLATNFDDWFSKAPPSVSQIGVVKSAASSKENRAPNPANSQNAVIEISEVVSVVPKDQQVTTFTPEQSQKIFSFQQIFANLAYIRSRIAKGETELQPHLARFEELMSLGGHMASELQEASCRQSFRVTFQKKKPAHDDVGISQESGIKDMAEECALSPEEQQKAKEMRDTAVAAANSGWPWMKCPPQLLLEAPYHLSRYNDPNPKDECQVPGQGFFKLPEMNHHCKLFQLAEKNVRLCKLGKDNILPQIYAYIIEYHSSAAVFASTCQKAFNEIAKVLQHWDVSRADFLEANDKINKKPPGKLIIASPHRTQGDEVLTAQAEMHALQELTFSLCSWYDNFEIIHLHRIPLLTCEVLAHVIPHMRNLKTLGVYRCKLISLAHTNKLLNIVSRAHGIETHKAPAKLDFSPRFHVGPVEQGIPGSHGSYGVTWDNSQLDTRLAIWCSVEKSIRLAKQQGIADCILSEESAFRQWVEKLCWNVGPTMEAIYNDTYADDPCQLAALFDFPRTAGRKDMLRYDAPFWGQYYRCSLCEENILGIFYTYEDNIRRGGFINNTRVECLCCQLFTILYKESDHFKLQERVLTGTWMTKKTNNHETFFGNKSSTEQLFTPEQREKALCHARDNLENWRAENRKVFAEERRGYKEELQLPLQKFIPVSPKVTDGKDHISNPPGPREAGIFSWDVV